MSDFKPGLEGVVAFETQIAEPDREGGALRYRGVDIEDLVGQVSFGHLASPEASEPGSLDRATASVSHQRAFAGGRAATMVAVGLDHGHSTQAAVLAESTVELTGANVVFTRLEYVQKSGHDLALEPPLDAGIQNVASVVLGYLRNFPPVAQVVPGLGLRAAGTYLPAALGPVYGSRRFPLGVMIYVRLLPAAMRHREE